MDRHGMSLEHDIVQLAVHEAIRTAMDTPLREPILRAVELSTEEGVVQERGEIDTAEPPDTGRSGRGVKGLLALLLLGVVVYVVWKHRPSTQSD